MSFAAGTAAVHAGHLFRRRQLRRRFLAEWQQSKGRVVVLGAIGVGFFAFLFGSALAAGAFLASAQFASLAVALLLVVWWGAGSSLLLSCLAQAANAFFAADDAWFWDASPAPAWARFTDAVLRTSRSAFPALLLMTASAASGLLLGSGHDVLVVVRAVVATLLHSFLVLFIAVAVVQSLAAVLPAGQVRRVSLVGLGGILVVVILGIRQANLPALLTGKDNTAFEKLEVLQAGGPTWLWTHDLFAFVQHGTLSAALIGWTTLLASLSYGAFKLFFKRARDKAADVSEKGSRSGLSAFLLQQATAVLSVGLPSSSRALVLKDLRVFVRDPAQWSQAALLLGVGVLYAINLDMLQDGFKRIPELRDVLLMAFHVGTCCFVASGLAARFSFPQVALEGEAFWMLQQSPVDNAAMLRAKARANALLVVGFPTLLASLGAVLLPLPWHLKVISAVGVASTSWQVVRMGVGMGAVGPRFDAATVMEATMGAAAVSTMMWGMVVAMTTTGGILLAMLLASFSPAAWALLLVVVAVPWWRGRRAMRLGAAALDDRRVNPPAA